MDPCCLHQGLGIADPRDDVKLGLSEEARDALAHEDRIVGED
jgi:hypothetical protein